ncbi:Putative flavin-containing monooxygenase YUCCA11 [Morus notabilis]|uniref:Flavin-containing monooxygenase n=1 Tax=Morus notabilis TaxID=981085 RepID=W9QHP3_9ROSA|nr:Putative flavin-containing monooxygenase YUCCA11 [Morus notabilis]
MPFPEGTQRYASKDAFIQYLGVLYPPRYRMTSVESASLNVEREKRRVVKVYFGEFIVVATGEISEGFIPKLRGLESFEGDFMHSSLYTNGEGFSGKEVLVVGSGNSGMEIAYDLSDWNANTSLCVR